jgi:hypothetical protein
MNRRSVSSLRRQLFACLAASLLLPDVVHAVSLDLSPGSVTADYSGTITLNITGLTTGQAVRVETFVDGNGNGAVDSGDMLMQSFEVIDGQAPSIGGVRNINVPGDEDGHINNQIRTVLNFRALAEVLTFAPSQVYQVSPLGGGSPQTKTFTITQPYSQGVNGKVKSGSSAVPFAFVFLITPSSDGPVGGTLSDASGNFTLKCEPGSYMLGAAKSGFVFDLDEAPQVTIGSGATVTQNVTVSAANRTISGRLTDADSGDGIPAVQMTAEASDPGLFTLVLTDADGNFTLPVSSAVSEWGLWASDKSAALLGYLALDDNYAVDINGGSVSGVSIQWSKAESLVWGILTDGQGHGIAGVQIEASNDQNYAVGLTDSSGNYLVGTGSGGWWVGPSSDDLGSRGYFASGVNLNLAIDEAHEVNFVAQEFSSHLIGRVTDDGGHAVDNICINAYPTQGGSGPDATTDGDGNFSLGVFGGTWNLSLCSEDAQARGLVRPTLSFNVADGADITGIQYVARRATAQITGWVKDSTNAPVGGIGIGAHITVDTVNYDPWGQTDSEGNFSLGVFSGAWSVGVSCYDLQLRGYTCVVNQPVTISGNNGVANFTVYEQPPLEITTSSLPNGNLGVPYGAQLTASGGVPSYYWSLAPGSGPLPPNLNLAGNGYISGTPTSSGTYNFTARVNDSGGHTADRGLALVILSPVSTPTITGTPPSTPTPTATPTRGPCVGDCSGNGQVTVDELVKGVNIALGTLALDQCSNFDCNGTGHVTVDCLVKAVNDALGGC